MRSQHKTNTKKGTSNYKVIPPSLTMSWDTRKETKYTPACLLSSMSARLGPLKPRAQLCMKVTSNCNDH